MNLKEAKKISIVGNSGAGKSTLSKKLGKVLGIDVYPVDKIYWLSGWELRNEESFNTTHEKWMNKSSWIIEGVGYWDEMEKRISRSDLTIFLDVPASLCKERAELRIEKEMLSPNKDITAGCVYGKVRNRQMEIIDYFNETLRPRLVAILSGLSNEKVLIINSYSDLDIENETSI